MTPLEKITSIPVDFGKPLDFNPPNVFSFLKDINDEYSYTENDGHTDIISMEIDLFHNSLTEDERKEYDTLMKKVDELAEKWDIENEPFDSPNAQAYSKAEDERENFFATHGAHLCYSCSYYVRENLDSLKSICEYDNRNIAVRPYCLACRHYFTGQTPQQKKLDMESRRYFSKHPEAEKEYRKTMRRTSAERFAINVRNIEKGDNTAFLLADDFAVKRDSDYYKNLYCDFPELFKDTICPTYDSFLYALKRWKDLQNTTTTETKEQEHA